jgi:hypothetical protein
MSVVDQDQVVPLPEVIARRIRGAFGSTYLTLMSVMQGVALAALAARVAETSGSFDVGDWVLTLNTFVVFVVVWNEYLVAALAFAWIPSFLDSLLPFSLLAAELFLAHFIVHDLRAWLLAMGAASLVSLVALVYTRVRVGGGDPEQRALYTAVNGHYLVTILMAALGTLFFLGAGVLYERAGLVQERVAVLVAATIAVGLYLSRAVLSWRRIHRYTRAKPRGGARS